jgi:hypothetical protein
LRCAKTDAALALFFHFFVVAKTGCARKNGGISKQLPPFLRPFVAKTEKVRLATIV